MNDTINDIEVTDRQAFIKFLELMHYVSNVYFPKVCSTV